MGEFTGVENTRPEEIAASDQAIRQSTDDNQVNTDVDDVFADGEKMGMPVFNVDKSSFYQNMEFGRKRVRFPTGSKAQQYMQKTKYNRPFWIAHDDNGQVWTRKIK